MRALQRLVAILNCVGHAQGRIGISGVAAECDLPLPTAARLVHELCDAGLVVRSLGDGQLSLGPAVQRWSAQAIGARAPDAARTAMRWLRDVTGETVSLQVLVGSLRVCVASEESKSEIRRVVPVGTSQSAVVGATGEALLAYLSRESVEVLARSCGLAGSEVEGLHERLTEARKRGFASASDVVVPGVAAVAVPIYRERTEVLGVLAVSGPTFRFTEQRRMACVPALLESARRVALAWR